MFQYLGANTIGTKWISNRGAAASNRGTSAQVPFHVSHPLLQSGCDIANVQALAGHKSIKTTQRYLDVATQLRREAVNRLKLPEVGTTED